MNLVSLPNELVSKIIRFLNGSDVLELSLVNRKFNALCNCRTIWFNILKHYKVTQPSLYGFTLESLGSLNWLSLQSLFINVLDKWGWLFGPWKRHISAFGGLLFVRLEISPFQVIGYDVIGIDLDINLVPMFAINIRDYLPDGENVLYVSDAKISCNLYSRTEHHLTIEHNVESTDVMKICCRRGDPTQHHDIEKMIEDFAEAVGINKEEIPHALFSGLTSGGIEYSKIHMPLVSCDVKLIEPGFFAGDYSAHGTEILLLKYDENSIQLEKVSGDKNVRYGTVSIDIDMTYPVDYLKVLKFIATKPHEFNVRNIIDKFKINSEGCPLKVESNLCYVEKGLIQDLKYMHPRKSFGVDESDNSFIAAFKGKITLGNMPDAAIPDYFFYEVLAIITNENSLYALFHYDELRSGFNTVDEMPFKRVCF